MDEKIWVYHSGWVLQKLTLNAQRSIETFVASICILEFMPYISTGGILS